MDITGTFRWWVGVVLAGVSYVFLHYFAIQEIAAPANIKDFTDSVGKQFLKTLAVFGQYILPVIFLAGSLVSVIARRKHVALHASAAISDSALE